MTIVDATSEREFEFYNLENPQARNNDFATQ